MDMAKEDFEARFCPYCGTKNSITNGQCNVCGGKVQIDDPWILDGGEEDDSSIYIVPEDPPVDPLVYPPVDPHPYWKFLIVGVCSLCAVLLMFFIVIKMISGRDSGENSGGGNGSDTNWENHTVSELIDSDTEDDGKYTASHIRLTEFGGETTGNELIIHENVHDNYNNSYAAGLGGERSGVENCTEYFIGGQYKYLSFRVVLSYERRTDVHPDTYLRIYADGSQIYKSEHVRSGFKPEDVTLDIRGAEKIKVGICGQGDIRVVDPVFHNEKDAKQFSTMVSYSNQQDADRVPLSYLEYWNGSSAEGGLRYISGIIKDSTGKMYDGAFAGTHEDSGNWVEYDIEDCGFKKLTGTIILNPDPGGIDSTTPVVVISENPWRLELYRSEPVTKDTTVQHFEVSLKNTKQLVLQIGGKYDVRVVDCYLSK